MAPNNMAVGAVRGRMSNPVDAVRLYEATNKHINMSSIENPFAGSRQGLGVGVLCFSGEGRVDGQPPTEYAVNERGYTEEVKRTFDCFF